MTTALELYNQGKLKDAIAASLEDVKKHPADVNKRNLLCELLCIAGDLERADKQLDTLAQQDAKAALGVSLFRQLLRAEQARQQFYANGRLPDFLNDEITPDLRRRLEASVLLREGKKIEAARLLADAESERPKPSGMCNDQAFDDFRDVDDMTASFFEVLTSTGKYYWIPMERVELIEFRAWERPRDLLWRRAHMIVRDGPDGEVYLPVLYAGSAADADEQIRLGRSTDWRGEEGAPIRGVGQRIYLAGELDVPILEMKTFAAQA